MRAAVCLYGEWRVFWGNINNVWSRRACYLHLSAELCAYP